MPTLPYFNILSLINGTLLRLSDSQDDKGWEYYLAYKHKKVNSLTYDFWLRDDVRFQDGSNFDADSVVENFKHFFKGPFLYSNIHNALDYVEKLDKYKIRIHLKKPYGILFNDLCVINFYTKEYYKKYNWRPSYTAQNTKGSGLYGAGPYILEEGYATGTKQSEKIVLKANPYYFEKNKPYIEKNTIYTQLTINEVINKISKKEGELDIAYIPFDKKTEIVNSKYAKLLVSPSNRNLLVHMNLLKNDSKLKDIKVRQALNDAIDQKNLIKFVFKNEAKESPFLLSTNAYYSKDISKNYINRKSRFTQKELKNILNGLSLNIVPMKQAVKKQYEARDDYQIFSDLAKEFGVFDKYTQNKTEMQWIEEFYNKAYDQAKKMNMPMPTFREFWKKNQPITFDVPYENTQFCKIYRL